jgi:hypothetical protein
MVRRLWLRASATPRSMWIIYALIYLSAGGTLQLLAPDIRVARLAHDWQVITLYGFFLVPLSILLREEPWHRQYAYALVAIAPIDVIGFAIHSSIAYPYNLIDWAVGERNFTLTFVMIASWIPFLGNKLVANVAAWVLPAADRRTSTKSWQPQSPLFVRTDRPPDRACAERLSSDFSAGGRLDKEEKWRKQ